MKSKFIQLATVTGLNWFVPVIRLAARENPKEQIQAIGSMIGIPMVTFSVFLLLWAGFASQIQTSLGRIPGPVQVFEQAGNLFHEYREERLKRAVFYQKQKEQNAKQQALDPQAEVKVRKYTGKPTYVDQIATSLRTVFTGFLIASLIAVPIGILCGLNPSLMTALNPLIQIFKPVSPVAWLPIVTMVVSALYTTQNGGMEKSFIISAITVSLCSLWPSLINTALFWTGLWWR